MNAVEEVGWGCHRESCTRPLGHDLADGDEAEHITVAQLRSKIYNVSDPT